MKIAIYARVSTTNHGQDPEVQLGELREYCQRRGWEISHEYADVGISGSKEKRPELDKLLHNAHRRYFDAVVVWRFDRFARSVSHLLKAWRISARSASSLIFTLLRCPVTGTSGGQQSGSRWRAGLNLGESWLRR